MQCPNCGFENIPGVQECCVCSTSLEAKPTSEPLYPPRARERSFSRKMSWWVSTHPHAASLGRLVGKAKATLESPVINARMFGVLLMSMIPGLSHIRVLGDRRSGYRMLAASAAAVGIAVLVYRTFIADVMLYLVLALSMFSVTSVGLWLRGGAGKAGNLAKAGIALLVISSYLFTYLLLRVALSPYIVFADVVDAPVVQSVLEGDTLLVRRHGHYERGDVVIGSQPRIVNFGPILGVPGDRLNFGEEVLVNGKPTGIRLRAREREWALPHSDICLVLEEGQYWVMPQGLEEPVAARDFGLMGVNQIWGKPIAIIGPPSRRGLLKGEQPQ